MTDETESALCLLYREKKMTFGSCTHRRKYSSRGTSVRRFDFYRILDSDLIKLVFSRDAVLCHDSFAAWSSLVACRTHTTPIIARPCRIQTTEPFFSAAKDFPKRDILGTQRAPEIGVTTEELRPRLDRLIGGR